MKSFNDLRHKTMSQERIDRNRREAIMSHPNLKPIPYYKSWRDREVDEILYDEIIYDDISMEKQFGFLI